MDPFTDDETEEGPLTGPRRGREILDTVEPIDTDEDAESRTWENDDDDAEEGILDDGPDDLVDEGSHGRDSYWG